MNDLIADFIRLALSEDVGEGDHTTQACIREEAQGTAHLIVKKEGILAGCKAAERIFRYVDPTIEMHVNIEDGVAVTSGDIAFTVTGKIRTLLQHERLVLNVMQRMSGIATETYRYVKAVEGTCCRILDTRKTSPCMRAFDKEAVRIGGAFNHRTGLFDMILIKDNHVDGAGGIEPAINRVNKYLRSLGKRLLIEIEVRNTDELRQVLNYGGVDRILLDNFSLKQTEEAVRLVRSYKGNYELESSGGITLKNALRYARTGVDFISIGALTHSVNALDMSLKICSL
ncbi:MAG: carboxylating nicotinate-nucleotide diphosphorylase [Tannerellaceae bacterium]|jgi:nicotinate-nucleotide pyrophosphorylase (carboxylating)|nr:carboxylating nicotinate-nucleotide diphosphorylase [Tannerellaceae bacterium]